MATWILGGKKVNFDPRTKNNVELRNWLNNNTNLGGTNKRRIIRYVRGAFNRPQRQIRGDRDQINQTAAKLPRATVAAAGSVIPLAYGNIRTGPLVARAVVYSGQLVLLLIWGIGEWESIDELWLGDKRAESLVTATHYLGTNTQTVDPTLEAAISGWDNPLIKTIDGNVVSLVYSVIKVSPRKVQGFPQFEIVAKAKKVLPKTGAGSLAYSTNPALILADFESSLSYGRGRVVDYSTAETLADVADETLEDDTKRMELSVIFNSPSKAENVTQTLRAYARCMYRISGDLVQFVPDRPASSAGDITRANIIVENGGPQFFPELISTRDQPTVVRVKYTDKSEDVWSDGTVEVVHPGVSSGELRRREAVFDLPGISSYAQANRWAIERLNGYHLRNFVARMTCDDSALAWEVGDVRQINFSPSIRGVTTKLVRLLSISEISPGRHSVVAEEYDPAVYSDEIATGPTYPDTTLPSPFDPFPPDSVSMEEELYTDQTGTTYSRMRATWSGIDWPYADGYRVTVNGNKAILDIQVKHRGTGTHAAITAAVTQGVIYSAKVYTISTTGNISESYSEATVTALGKLIKPTDVPSIIGYEAGQFVALQWAPATDIDLTGYQIRRGSVSDIWESATIVVSRVDATSYLDSAVPDGVQRYFIKALDSVGQESVNATFTDITVTADNTSAVATNDFVLADVTVQYMHTYEINGQGRYAITSFSETWTDRFGSAGTAWNATTVKPWCLDHADTDNSFVDAGEWDIGVDRSGQWSFNAMTEEISYGAGVPAVKETLWLATDAGHPSYSIYPGNATTKPGRYMKFRIKDDGDGPDTAIRVKFPIQGSLVGKITELTGTESIPASGQPLAVSFTAAYAAAPKITVTPHGSNPRIVTADNITATGFDLYAWDSSGTAAAATVTWRAQGT